MSAVQPPMIFYVPTDRALLVALARVSLRHGHLERVLQMTVKALEGMTVLEALQATERTGPARLRGRIEASAQKLLVEHEAVSKRLHALLYRTERASRKQNMLLHGVWGIPQDGGEPMIQTSEGKWVSLPTAAELRELSREIESLIEEFLGTRFYGYLVAALRRD